MSQLWRLQTNTDSSSGQKIAQYCLQNNVIAMGWSLKDTHLEKYKQNEGEFQEIKECRDNIACFDDYKSIVERHGIYGGRVNDNVQRLQSEVSLDDLIWMRKDGLYYLGRVSEKSHWIYVCDPDTLENDAANQVCNIEWHLIGDESDVPGAIATAMIRGKVLQHVWKSGALEYSQILFNEKVGRDHYRVQHMNNNASTFYSLLSPDDCEDLLCLWLYNEYGYICVPSTNKKSTELYECVLRDPRTGKHVYPQVKAGEVDIDASNYTGLNGEVWLFTTKGKVTGTNANGKSVHVADPEQLFVFAGSNAAQRILPCSIVKWHGKLTTYSNG